MDSIKILSIEMYLESDGTRFRCASHPLLKELLDVEKVTDYIVSQIEDNNGNESIQTTTNVA